ncbi:hypothetical protein KR059_003657, partial [Drosophila kikkawai]
PPIKASKPTMACSQILYIMIIIVLTPFFYVDVVFYVTPQLLGPIGFTLNAVVCTWISYNILGNMWACYRKTSSVDSLPLELRTPAEGEEHLWRYCKECQRLMPPRSWHCKICNCCILKRDHHCNFTGNCIGHNNQRYFIWLTFYMGLGSSLALVYNFIFVWRHGFVLANELFSIAALQNGPEPDLAFRGAISMVVYGNIVCVIFPFVMFFSAVSMVRRNTVMFDTSNREYDMGWWRNFSQVLGKLQFWTCLSPAIKSPLPHDGAQWKTKDKE